MFDFKNGEFSFSVTPVILTDRGREMKERVCVSISVMDHRGLVADSQSMDEAIARLSIPLFGGPLEGGWYRADRLEGEEPHIEWNASFHKDRLGVRPDLIEAAAEIPGNEDDIETLFFRITGEGVVPDEDEGGVLIAP